MVKFGELFKKSANAQKIMFCCWTIYFLLHYLIPIFKTFKEKQYLFIVNNIYSKYRDIKSYLCEQSNCSSYENNKKTDKYLRIDSNSFSGWKWGREDIWYAYIRAQFTKFL